MEQKHTPEPWHVGPFYKTDIMSSHGHVGCAGSLQSPQGITNAHRIVACVNACQGIDDPAKFVEAVRELDNYAGIVATVLEDVPTILREAGREQSALVAAQWLDRLRDVLRSPVLAALRERRR